MNDDDLTALGRQLATLFPVAAQHRGWTVTNLRHNFEQTAWGVEESWTCEIVGPRDLDVQRHRYLDGDVGKRGFSWGIHATAMGTAESVSAEGLLDQVRQIVDALGIRDLKEPRTPVAAAT